MMLRITRSEASDAVPALRLEGWLTGQTAGELEAALDLAPEPPLLLDVAGIRFVDDAGAAVLCALRRRGWILVGATPFLAEMMQREPEAGGRAVEPDRAAASAAESELVGELRAGSDAAYERLVRDNAASLLAVARRFVAGEEEARDVVQEAFLSAFRGIASFGGGAKLSTWLHRITVNAALMRLRTRRRRPEEPIEDLLPCFDDTGHWVSPGSGWQAPTERAVESRELRAAVRRCIDRLPETHRTVLLLRDIEDLDTEEAAVALGITPNAVKIRLHRARQALRTLLAAELGDAVTGGRAAAASSPPATSRPARTSRSARSTRAGGASEAAPSAR